MNKITTDHLARRAFVYVRQSSPRQVKHNLESQRLQYALADRARALGWQEVEVIDEDLGSSATGTRRSGFEQLLRAVCAGEVGAVFSVEASRLARNGREWHTLLDFCALVGVLLIDADKVYDPRLIDDRLVLGLKGTISEMEVANFRERGQAAALAKAKRGELIRRASIGYVKTPDERLERGPDARIRSAIELVFRKFAELGSVRQAYFWLDREQIQLPIGLGAKGAHKVVWQPARYHAVLSILQNPVYAGAYVYGRSKTVASLEDGQKRLRRLDHLRREEWTVLILDHHEGYIDWDTYERNQEMIANNANARSNAVRGSVKQGPALLAGLLRCGHCGAKVLAQYPRAGVIRYQCSGYVLNRDQACCVMFGGLRADRLVSEQLLQCLTPLGIQAATEAFAAMEESGDERIRQKALAIEQARYEAARARRQYDAVDPDNRLVAAELERRWNQSLAVEAGLEAELAALNQARRLPLTNQQKSELLDIARDLPRLWEHPQSSPEHKKRLLRIALREIITTSEVETIRLVLHWQGGDHTQLEFPKIRTGHHRFATDSELVEVIRKLARIEPDARIASILNRGRQPTAHGLNWTATRICSVRKHHAIAGYREGERQARGEMFVGEVEDRLGLTASRVLQFIHTKRLSAEQVCANAPWIVRKEDLEKFIAEPKQTTPPSQTSSTQLTLEI
ncbi:MAG TPA: recombinase family protein [Terracidiphilus sp.]